MHRSKHEPPNAGLEHPTRSWSFNVKETRSQIRQWLAKVLELVAAAVSLVFDAEQCCYVLAPVLVRVHRLLLTVSQRLALLSLPEQARVLVPYGIVDIRHGVRHTYVPRRCQLLLSARVTRKSILTLAPATLLGRRWMSEQTPCFIV